MSFIGFAISKVALYIKNAFKVLREVHLKNCYSSIHLKQNNRNRNATTMGLSINFYVILLIIRDPIEHNWHKGSAICVAMWETGRWSWARLLTTGHQTHTAVWRDYWENTLHIYLPPWVQMKELHISILAKLQQSTNNANYINDWLFKLKPHKSCFIMENNKQSVGWMCDKVTILMKCMY